ncbi:hypothetical protein D3C87_195960 [compost metagenome]|nr:hypothetical protein SAMN04487898_104193 [Pedobacter sp. ok626]
MKYGSFFVLLYYNRLKARLVKILANIIMLGELIEKEAIDISQIIHADQNHTEELRDKLNAAQRLGNEFKSKADITFNTKEGPKTVSTTVWSVTSDYLQLKSGIHIPLNSLLDIEF